MLSFSFVRLLNANNNFVYDSLIFSLDIFSCVTKPFLFFKDRVIPFNLWISYIYYSHTSSFNFIIWLRFSISLLLMLSKSLRANIRESTSSKLSTYRTHNVPTGFYSTCEDITITDRMAKQISRLIPQSTIIIILWRINLSILRFSRFELKSDYLLIL